MEGLPSDTIYGYFEQTVQKFSEKSAVIYLGTEFTYGELKDLVERFAASLQYLGVTKGDRVILYLSNTPQWVIAWLGLMRLGAVSVPISPIYTPVDLEYMANDSEAETIICMDTNFGYVKDIIPETRLKRVIVTTMGELLPDWKQL